MRHRPAHRNMHKHQVRADTHTQSAHTQPHTQFSWCNDPFGIEQHLFSKWRLVVGMLVIFSLTQWTNREGRILFRTYNQWPVLSQHYLVILVSPVTTTHTDRGSILKESTIEAILHSNFCKNKTTEKHNKSRKVTDNDKREMHLAKLSFQSCCFLYFLSSLLALLEGRSGSDSLYFMLCHYQPGSSLNRMTATSCRENRLCELSFSSLQSPEHKEHTVGAKVTMCVTQPFLRFLFILKYTPWSAQDIKSKTCIAQMWALFSIVTNRFETMFSAQSSSYVLLQHLN